jgi:hypothetical protein
MKFIPKNIKYEPTALQAHRNTEGSTYQSIKGLKEALLQEQGNPKRRQIQSIFSYCSMVFEKFSF